jgi:glyoxylase-like metal-dependent hydrolase (beta-lactamase superfamily II)
VEITPQIHGIDFQGRVWAYACLERDRITLIDSGVADRVDTALEGIRTTGRTAEDVRQIVLTHCHKDHTGLVAEMKRRSGATAIAHGLDAPVIRKWEAVDDPVLTDGERRVMEQISGSMPDAEPAGVDQELSDGDEIEIAGENARVIQIPGHTPGSIGIFMPKSRILFTGDAAASLSGKPVVGYFNIDPPQARRSFARLADLDFKIACFGHGPPLLKDASFAFRREAERLART